MESNALTRSTSYAISKRQLITIVLGNVKSTWKNPKGRKNGIGKKTDNVTKYNAAGMIPHPSGL